MPAAFLRLMRVQPLTSPLLAVRVARTLELLVAREEQPGLVKVRSSARYANTGPDTHALSTIIPVTFLTADADDTCVLPRFVGVPALGTLVAVRCHGTP